MSVRICDKCGFEHSANLYGQGTCTHCGWKSHPINRAGEAEKNAGWAHPYCSDRNCKLYYPSRLRSRSRSR